MKQIPDIVWNAVNDKEDGFDRLYYHFLKEEESSSKAFERTVDEINKYFPKYKCYNSVQSYMVVRNRRYKKMQKLKKRGK
jgi:hypothetical protein